MAVAHRGDRDTGGGSSGEFSLARALWKAAIFSPRLVPTQKPVGANVGKPQAKESKYVFLQPHPSAHTLFNVFLSTQLPTNHTPWHSPAHQRDKTHIHPPMGKNQSLTPGSLYKPLKQPHLPGGQQQKQEELQPCSLLNGGYNHRKSDRMAENYVPDEWTR